MPAVLLVIVAVALFGVRVHAATPTTVTLTSSRNPSGLGQSVTLTATLSSNTATGTVDFFDGATQLDSTPLSVTNGVATMSVSSLTLGSHSLTATYNGDTNDYPGTSPAVTQTVTTDPTTITLTPSSSTAVYGQDVTFTAVVSNGLSNMPVPSGSVTFLDGAIVLGTDSLAAGVATQDSWSMVAGSHSITASYSGDSTNAASSTSISYTVNPAATFTDWMSSCPNPSVMGQVVNFDADIDTVAPGDGTPTGNASFYNGSTLLGTVALDWGHAYLSTSAFNFGANNITVQYAGDANHAASTSSIYTQIVLYSTSVALTVSPTSTTPGQPVTLTATVSSSGGVTPTGVVEFKDNEKWLGAPTMVNGVATWTLSPTTVGAHNFTAEYEGDSNNGESTGSATLTVNPAPTSTVLSCDANGVAENSSTTCTLVVTDTSAAATVPTGTATFSGSGVTTSPITCNLTQDTANSSSCTTSVTPIIIGTTSVTGSYNGDSRHATSSGNTVTINGLQPAAGSWSTIPATSVSTAAPLATKP